MFCSDYPRGIVNCPWLWGLPAFHALPVAPALTVPLLLAGLGCPVSFLGLPSRPFPRRFPALFAAITLARLPGSEALIAPFQQTAPHPRLPRRDCNNRRSKKFLHGSNVCSRLTN